MSILQFKEDQGDRYERYDPVRWTDFYLLFSISLHNWKNYFYSTFSRFVVYLTVSADCW